MKGEVKFIGSKFGEIGHDAQFQQTRQSDQEKIQRLQFKPTFSF